MATVAAGLDGLRHTAYISRLSDARVRHLDVPPHLSTSRNEPLNVTTKPTSITETQRTQRSAAWLAVCYSFIYLSSVVLPSGATVDPKSRKK
jgi:hypothetical protein